MLQKQKAECFRAPLSFCKSDPDWIRTNDPQLRRLVLYPAELPGRSHF